MIFCLKYKD